MKEEKSGFAAFVRRKRKAEGMTQVQLAQTAGVGLRFLRELEAGKPTLRLDKINQVLWLFGYEAGPVALPEETEILGDEES